MTDDMPGPSADFGTFFLPGPTEVRPEILAAMQAPMMPHRGKAFEAVFARVGAGLRDVFRTGRPVYVCASSASGLMEGGIRNAPAGPILALVNGAFSERFGRIAAACSRQVDVLSVPWGQSFDLEQVDRYLAAGAGRYAVVTVVHSETSTGVLTDVRAISDVAHRHGATCLVDSVSGIAGVPLLFDEWGLDFVLTGSQKALALPPGLALAAASAGYLDRARTVLDRGSYFDIVEFEEFAEKNQTPSTPALSLLYALDAQVADIAREGIERRWERHEAMARMTWDWVTRMREKGGHEIDVLALQGTRSFTVTAITLPARISGTALVGAVADRGFTVGTGYGQLKETTFRIGHMGDHTLGGLRRCLDACEDALTACADRGI